MDKVCKTCQHWKLDKKIKHPRNIPLGECENVSAFEYVPAELFIRTKEDFTCQHWEPSTFCKNCKHWKRFDPPKEEWGECAKRKNSFTTYLTPFYSTGCNLWEESPKVWFCRDCAWWHPIYKGKKGKSGICKQEGTKHIFKDIPSLIKCPGFKPKPEGGQK